MNYLEIIGTLVGLVYLWLEYRASIYLWIAGIVMPVIYLFVYYRAGLYADFGINIYYLLAAAYGWMNWVFKKKDVTLKELPITIMPLKKLPKLIFVFTVLFVGIHFILKTQTDSTVPISDSIVTALSVIALWMLAQKYVQQWLVWMVVDVICCGLYAYKELPFTAGLYGLYAVIAILGYLKWKRLMIVNLFKQEKDNLNLIKPDALIVAAGEMPRNGIWQLVWLKFEKTPYVICCDGAMFLYEKACKNLPDVVVGDCDSITPAIERLLGARNKLHYDPDQETNDLTKAVRFALSNGKTNLYILGGTGKREDHTLGNISLLIEYMRMGANVQMLTDYGIFIPAKDTRQFQSYEGQQISIFNFGATNLSAEGLKYPIRDFTNWWQGTLNEATSSEFTIKCTGDYLIFLAY